MKMKCIKDFLGMNLLTVGKIYDVKEETIGSCDGMTIYCVTNDYGNEFKLSDKTLGIYFEKAD